MTRIFSCDRCHTQQTCSKHTKYSRLMTASDAPGRWHRFFISNQALDLCPTCIKSLAAWIKAGKKGTK